MLEEAADAGQVRAYAIATWPGFTDRFFTISQLDRLASEADGGREHHLRAVQLPVNQ
ncbi:hypothetical protein ACIRPT_27210 [Streptomyces sp. NPDC101227]|uniref:hypothetical protein n=1 Tax=Streptomyces sp. NPDC101227 TaxID=3366136 RepID=UPI0037F33FF1